MKKNSYFKACVIVISILFLQNLYTTEITFASEITSILENKSIKKKAYIKAAYNKYARSTSSADLIEALSKAISDKFKGEINTENINLSLDLKELEVGSTRIMPLVVKKTLDNDTMQKMSLDDIFTALVEKKSFPMLLYCLNNSKTNPEYRPLATLSQILAKTDPAQATDDNFIDLTWDLMQTDLVAKNPALWKKMLLISLDRSTEQTNVAKDRLNTLLDKFEYVFKTSLSYNLSEESKTPFRSNGSVYSKYLMKKMTPQEIKDYAENGLYQDNTEEDTKLKIPKSQSSLTEKLGSFSMKKMSWLTSIFKYSRLALKIRGLSFNSNPARYTKCMQLAQAFKDTQTKELPATGQSPSEERTISALKKIATILTTVKTTPLVDGQPQDVLKNLLEIDPTGELIKKHVIPELNTVNLKGNAMVRFSFIDQLEALLSEKENSREQSNEIDYLPENSDGPFDPNTITQRLTTKGTKSPTLKTPTETGTPSSGTARTLPSSGQQQSAAERKKQEKARKAEKAKRLLELNQDDHNSPELTEQGHE
jgi:hypothetical protein